MIPGSSAGYRPDVDGLRALAVSAVLAFHAFPHALPGGFAGVDVFFVISGFLITGILLAELEAGRFSLGGFYWRRVRRIFPALLLVLAATLALGWRVLLPDEFAALGKHVAAGAAFVSNLALWREAGYFDAAAEFKPLLHLWSLGIEEQYYLLWPVMLYAFSRSRRALPAMILAVGVASFALNIALVGSHPTWAFYLPVTRFWELLGGSALAFLAGRTKYRLPQGNAASLAGVALIVAGLVLLDRDRAFPGWWALLPVGGTMLVIAAGPHAWLNRRIFSNRAVVYVGLISYPLYLWHWPLLAYARIIHGGEAPAALRLALLAIAMLLSVLTYELVEKPIRSARLRSLARRTVPALGAGMALAFAGGVAARQAILLPSSAADPEVAEIARAASDWDGSRNAVIAGDSPRAVLFFGDSHMEHYLPRVREILREHRAPLRTVIIKTEGGCAPVPGIERRSQHCSAFVDEGFRLAHLRNVDIVVIAASWPGFVSRGDYHKAGDADAPTLDLLAPSSEWVLRGFEAQLASLVHEGKHVVLVLSSPRGSAFSPKSVVERDWVTVRISHPFFRVPIARLHALTRPIDERLQRIAERVGATVLDPTQWLCNDGFCPAADRAGRPLYMDDSHIRASVARVRLHALDRFVLLPEGIRTTRAAVPDK